MTRGRRGGHSFPSSLGQWGLTPGGVSRVSGEERQAKICPFACFRVEELERPLSNRFRSGLSSQ
jgi:hypothetical protein